MQRRPNMKGSGVEGALGLGSGSLLCLDLLCWLLVGNVVEVGGPETADELCQCGEGEGDDERRT
jgi:hypothetical protein